MKTKLLNIVFIAFVVVFLAGCRKKESLNVNIVDLGGDDWAKSELDQWLYTNFTNPYNIEVKYKWDRSELSEIYKNVVPIKEELVKPVMEAIKKAWIEPYIAVKDEKFFKKYCQKQFYLAGSPSYELNGTATLGIAEGGRKIILLNLNDYNNDQMTIKKNLHTMHHEFAHILNQNKAISPDYQRITPSDYTVTWFNIAPKAYSKNLAIDKVLYEADFWGKGFITPYSRANKDEDFVEMLATLLEGGQANFDNIINNLFIYDEIFIKRNYRGVYEKNTDARDKLLKKAAMVIEYLNSWGISLADLQAKTQAAIEALSPTPDFHTILGSDKDKIYKTITINPQKLTGLSAKFLTAFNTANNAMLAAPNSRYIDNISLIFSQAEKMILNINYFNPLISPNSFYNNYNAEFSYTISNTEGLLKLKYTDPQPNNANARAIEQYVNALLVYFNDQEFNIRWIDDIVPQSKGIFGGLVKKTDPSSYLYGTLEK